MSKTSTKHERDKNSLEQFLLNSFDYFKKNRERVIQYILVILLVILAAMVIKYIMNRDTAAFQNDMDDAYYLSTNRSFLEFGSTPDPAPYEELAANAKGDFALILKLAAAESYWKQGTSEVERKRANSKAEVNDETAASLDPETTFNKAFNEFEGVLNESIKSADVKARALYNAAVAAESLASVAQEDTIVTERLAKAKSYYQQLVDTIPDSAYAKPAKQRLVSLSRPVSIEYYKKIANDFINLPIPEGKADEPIVSDQLTDLDPNAPSAVNLEQGEFSLENDSATTSEIPEQNQNAEETTDSSETFR